MIQIDKKFFQNNNILNLSKQMNDLFKDCDSLITNTNELAKK